MLFDGLPHAVADEADGHGNQTDHKQREHSTDPPLNGALLLIFTERRDVVDGLDVVEGFHRYRRASMQRCIKMPMTGGVTALPYCLTWSRLPPRTL